MQLKEYTSFEEKEKFFIRKTINTKKEFDVFYNSATDLNGIWRGSSEAKYKMYTSLQRF
jgi:hypothetical protein